MQKKVFLSALLTLLLFTTGCEEYIATKKTEEPQNNKQTPESKSSSEKAESKKETKKEEKPEKVDALADKRLDKTISGDASGKNIVTNPNDLLVVANKERNLPEDYVPADLVYPDVPFPFEGKEEKMMLRKEAAAALEELFKKAKEDKINLYAQSGFRSFERQKAIFASNSNRLGEEKANEVSAHAGQSEHQTGLTMDVTSPEIDFKLNQNFEKTKEGKWVQEHAHEFGFIIRYLRGKEEITGYQYEPWHLRYVGKEHAQIIKEKGITLEEYLAQDKQVLKQDGS